MVVLSAAECGCIDSTSVDIITSNIIGAVVSVTLSQCCGVSFCGLIIAVIAVFVCVLVCYFQFDAKV